MPRPPWRGLFLLLPAMIALLAVTALQAQDAGWDGNAAVVRKGEFSSPGLFAASDSFPLGTLIQVENPQNGATVQVTVVERINAKGNIFLLLSEEAAAVLGLSPADVIRVRARIVMASVESPRPGGELAASPDLDVNPAAGLQEPEPAAGQEAPPAAAAQSPAPAAQGPAAGEQAPAAPPPAVAEEPQPPVSAAAPQAPPAAAPSAVERRLEELSARLPQKRLFQPPPETAPAVAEPRIETPPAETPAPSEGPAQSLSAVPPESAPASESPALPEGPDEASVAGIAPQPAPEEELPPAAPPVAEEPPAVAPAPEVSAAPAAPTEAAGREPAAAAPVVEPAVEETPEAPAVEAPEPAPTPQPATEAPAIAAVPSAAAPAALQLARKSYYLQLGAYATRGLAEKLAKEVSSWARYSVSVLPSPSGSKQLFKVLIGPLNRDESGTLLYQFRARGFRDAFLQYTE